MKKQTLNDRDLFIKKKEYEFQIIIFFRRILHGLLNEGLFVAKLRVSSNSSSKFPSVTLGYHRFNVDKRKHDH